MASFKFVISIFFLFISFGCKKHSKLPISNNLEIRLGSKLNEYISLLNGAYKNDSTSLVNFLSIQNIGGAAGYDHGYNLYEIMRSIGDTNFAKGLNNLDLEELNSVKNYLEVGMFNDEDYSIFLSNSYPKTARILNTIR